MRVLRSAVERRIVRLAVPALGTLAAEPLYVLADTAIVGRLGTTQLGGLALAATVLLTTTALVSFLEYGVTPDVAYAHGAGDPHQARRAATDALALSLGIGTAASGVLIVTARGWCWLLGGRGDVLDAATTYLRIAALGVPFVLVALVGHGVMRGLNDLRKPVLIVLVANAVNVVLEVLAVYVLDLGIAGSAWSTVIAQALAAAWFLRVLRPHTTRSRPEWNRYRPVLLAGAHLAVRSVAMLAVWNTATIVSARIDTPTLAANQVLNQLFMALALTLDALAIPAQSLVAGALGAGDRDGAVEVGNASTRLSLLAGGILAAALVASCLVLPAVFSTDPDVRSRLTFGLLVLAVMQFPGAVAFALDGALIGGHDERFLARAAIVNLLGFAPLAIATLIEPRLGLAGLWGAQLMWMTVRAAVNHWRWRSSRWGRRMGPAAVPAPA